MKDSSYFAALPDADDFGERFSSKVQEYRVATAVKAVHARMDKAYQYHFGLSPSGVHLTSGITRGGEVGELAEVRINHLRANALTVLNLTTAPQITWRPVATNRDSASTKQAYSAVSLLDYYWLDRKMARYAAQAVAHAIPLTEGFVFTPWDDDAGDMAAVGPDGTPTKSGDFQVYNVLPWDVMRDPSKRSWDQLQWVAVCIWHNRYELVAKYPKREAEILDAPMNEGDAERKAAFGEIDDIPVWYFFHRPNGIPALRNGRESLILADGTVLKDGGLTYTDIPLHRVTPDEHFGTPYGYSQYHEGIGVQEAIDSLSSAILTNQDAFARQMIAVERGEEFSPEDIGGGKILYYTNKVPVALQLTSSPAEAFRFTDSLKKDLQRVQGVNDAVQGQLPGDSKLSGAALALLSSQALQQNSSLQSNYLEMVRSIGNCVLNEWQKRTPLPRKIKLVGKGNEFLCTEESMSGKSISDIKGVLIDIGNPLYQTAAGKMELLQSYLQIPGAVTSPEQIDQVTNTGRLDNLTHSARDESILILDENEMIADGKLPQAVIHDEHLQHGREHRATLASAAARENPAIVKASIEHLHQHYRLFFGWPSPMVPPLPPTLDPMTGAPDPTYDPVSPVNDPMYREKMLILVGQTPPPPMGMAPPGMGPPPPPGDPGGGTPPPGTPGANPPKPTEMAGNHEKLPSMPKNPQTGAEYVPAGGKTTVPA